MRKREAVLLIIMIVCIILYTMSTDEPHRVVRYDCRMSEVSPDVPVKVKELCRQARANNKPQDNE